jgi:hypothetical protein
VEAGPMAFHAFHSSSFPPCGPRITRSAQRGNYCREALLGLMFLGRLKSLLGERIALP